ncbi:MAG: GAF domain-containing protein [Chloroflexi bacterium]|nr:GAF domain-containing protein [Chloroflexota bacterium]
MGTNKPSTERPPSSSLRILLVEDSKHDQLAFHRAFEQSPVSVEITVYERAEQALEQLQTSAAPFDLVVSDYRLPGMSGLDMCRELVEQECPLPIVMLTGTGTEYLAVEALKIGVDDYIIKDPGHGYLKLLPVVLPDVVNRHRDRWARQQAEEALWHHTAQLEALRKVGLELTAQLDLDTLLYSIVSQALELLGKTSGGLYLRQPDRDVLEWTVAIGPRSVPLKSMLRQGEGLAGRVWETGEPLIVNDYQHWEGRAAIFEGFFLKAVMGVPIRWGDGFLGVLNVLAEPPHIFSPADAKLLSLFATQAAIAIRNARLLQGEREQREMSDALAKAAAAVNSTLDHDQVLDHILEQAERVIAGDACNIMLVGENNTVRTVRSRGYEHLGKGIFDTPSSITEYASLEKMIQTGEPLVIPYTAADPDWAPREGWEWLQSYVGAPIRVAGLIVGFLSVDGVWPGQFNLGDVQRLQAFAYHAATAIQNARLYQRLQKHAEQLEQRVYERTVEVQVQYARLDAILSSTTDGIIVTDERGKILQANPIAQTWLTQTLSPGDAGQLREAIQNVATQTEGQPVKLLELTGFDLELSAGTISASGAISEPSMRETVHDRPQETGSENPTTVVAVHNVSHLKALDRMKTLFVNNASDELSQPTATIKAFVYLIQSTSPESAKWEQHLDILVQEVDRLEQMVKDIRQISSIYTGRLQTQPRLVSLDELAEAAIASHKSLAQARGVTVVHRPIGTETEPGSVISIDPKQMMQVINILVQDAIHYTPEKGCVTVSTEGKDIDGCAGVMVIVSDMGEAIPSEDLPHLFERFFREKEPTSARVSETGLRLMIVKGIVELHGGRVMVESHNGQGNIFAVWLPS